MGGRIDDVTWLAVVGVEIALVLVSRRHAQRAPAHLPLVYAATYVLIADVVARILQREILHHASYPLAGMERSVYHAETLLLTGWPAAIAAAGLRIFFPEHRRAAPFAPVGAWLGWNLGMVLAFPLGWIATARLLQVWSVNPALVMGMAVWMCWSRRWTSAHWVVLILAVTELVVATVGPYATNPFKDWMVARALYFLAFGGLAAWYPFLKAPARR